jgi:hypothetical protein
VILNPLIIREARSGTVEDGSRLNSLVLSPTQSSCMSTYASISGHGIQPFLDSFAAIASHYEKARAHTSPSFTVFDFIKSDESCLSNIYSGLLDPKGSHGQGTLSLEILVSKLGGQIPIEKLSQARVCQGGVTYLTERRNRRMDINIECTAPGNAGFCIAIENNIHAAE